MFFSTLRLELAQDHGGTSGGDEPLVSSPSISLHKMQGTQTAFQENDCSKGFGLALADAQG